MEEEKQSNECSFCFRWGGTDTLIKIYGKDSIEILDKLVGFEVRSELFADSIVKIRTTMETKGLK